MKLKTTILSFFLFFYSLKFALCNPFDINTYDQKIYYDKYKIWYLPEYQEKFHHSTSIIFNKSYSYFDFIKNTLTNFKPPQEELNFQNIRIKNLKKDIHGYFLPTFYIKYKPNNNKKNADFEYVELNKQMFEKKFLEKLNLNIDTFSVTSNITQKYDFNCIYWKIQIQNEYTDMCFTQYINNSMGGLVYLRSYTLIDLNSKNKPKKFDYQNGDLINISGETGYINSETIDIKHYSIKLKPKNTKLIAKNVAKFIDNSPSKYSEYSTRKRQMKFVMQQKHKVRAKLDDIYFQNKWEVTKINVLVKY